MQVGKGKLLREEREEKTLMCTTTIISNHYSCTCIKNRQKSQCLAYSKKSVSHSDLGC